MLNVIFLKLITPLTQVTPPEPVLPRPTIESIQENLSSDGLIPTHWLLIAAGMVLLLLSALSIANWWKHRGENAHPLLVFSNTAQIVGLSYRQRWALLKVARNQSLASPLTLMLCATTFDHHVRGYLESCLSLRRESARRQLQDIRVALFSDPPQAVTA